MTLRRAALNAGTNPANTPTSALNEKANNIEPAVTTGAFVVAVAVAAAAVVVVKTAQVQRSLVASSHSHSIRTVQQQAIGVTHKHTIKHTHTPITQSHRQTATDSDRQ